MLNYEKKFYKKNKLLIAGCDEAGRGPVAGPLVVASCILPPYFNDELINDSKKLTKTKREKAYKLIIENALDYTIVVISVNEIDKENNIYLTTKKAMRNCFKKLKIIPDLYLTDAMPLNSINQKQVISIIKGDSISKNIAAASILAKVYRDNLMNQLDEIYPNYDFKNNKGYLTKNHNEKLNKYGYIKGIHRKTYFPIKIM